MYGFRAESVCPFSRLLDHLLPWTWIALSGWDLERPPVWLWTEERMLAESCVPSCDLNHCLPSPRLALFGCSCLPLKRRRAQISLRSPLDYHWFRFTHFLLSFRPEYFLWLSGPSEEFSLLRKGLSGCSLLNQWLCNQNMIGYIWYVTFTGSLTFVNTWLAAQCFMFWTAGIQQSIQRMWLGTLMLTYFINNILGGGLGDLWVTRKS